PNFQNRPQSRLSQKDGKRATDPHHDDSHRGRLVSGMHISHPVVEHVPPAHGKQHSRRGNQVPIESPKEGNQGGGHEEIYDPVAVQRLLKSDGYRKWSAAVKSLGGRDIGNREDYEPEEGQAYEDREDHGHREITF